MIGFTIIVVVLIICVTLLIDEYMGYCGKYGIGIFTNPKYEKRICELEKIVKELR